MEKIRKYAIPYNGSNPEWFLNQMDKRKKYIDHVFCELPFDDFLSQLRFLYGNDNGQKMNDNSTLLNRSLYMKNCSDFLQLTLGKYKRICPINAAYYNFKDLSDFNFFVKKVCNTLVYYSVEGVILSDYRLALVLRQLLPNLEIQTSCNGYQWDLTQMAIWRDNIGVKLFNPPREILRLPSKLKEMHNAGFRLKCIVNEGCLIGCPNSLNHQMCVALRCYNGSYCVQRGVADIFRSNWILPRWQKYYDEYVDVYKISGRAEPVEYIFYALDAYINEVNTIPLSNLMINGVMKVMRAYCSLASLNAITLDKIPDKLAFCECHDCKNCKLCKNVLSSILSKQECSLFDFLQYNVNKEYKRFIFD